MSAHWSALSYIRVVVSIYAVPAVGKGIVKKHPEQRHQFGNTEISRIGTDWAAGNAVVTGALVRLPDEIHLE